MLLESLLDSVATTRDQPEMGCGKVRMQYYRMHGRGLKTNPRRSFCFSLVQVRSSLIRAIASLQSGRQCEALMRQCCEAARHHEEELRTF